MIFKPYGDLPRTYAPDIGEVVEARRSVTARWVRAVVTGVRRLRDGQLKIRVQWIESDPDAGGADPTRPIVPIVAGDVGYMMADGDGPPLIRQIDRGPSA